MDTSPFDAARYGALLAEHRPVVIETPEEHDHMLSLAEQLMEKGDTLALEEEKLLAMVVFLIEAFERTIEADEDDDEGSDDNEGDGRVSGSVKPPAPYETLQRLMGRHGLQVGDVADVFGNPRLAQEVLNGTRPITRGQAKALGRMFRVPDKLFLE